MLVFKDESRECFIEVHIDNLSKIVIIYKKIANKPNKLSVIILNVGILSVIMLYVICRMS